MPLRLLAHGGNAFAERARIGNWPNIHPDVLQDLYGIADNQFSYGFGLLGGGSFLILRERQKSGERSYPYTLLLDPGETVWKRFEWNAASLINCILESCSTDRGSEQIADRIWTDPAQVQREPLAEWLEELKPIIPENFLPEETESLHGMLIGSCIGEVQLVVTPSQVGMEQRPSLALFSKALDALPAPFRRSRGWLVGGESFLGLSYGAELVIDDVPKDVTARVDPRVPWGLDVWRAWVVIEKSDLAPHLKAVEADAPITKPPIQSPEGGAALMRVANALQQKSSAAELLDTQSSVPASLAELHWQAAMTGKLRISQLTENQIFEALQYAYNRKIPLPEWIQACADPPMFTRALRQLGDLGDPPQFLQLTLTASFNLTLENLRQAESPPAEALATALTKQEWSEQQTNFLIHEALSKEGSQARPLSEWASLKDRQEVQDWLASQAKLRLQKQRPETWARDFLDYGDPADLEPELKAYPTGVSYLAEVALAALQTDGRPYTILEAMANRRLSNHLSSDTKRKIAAYAEQNERRSAWSAWSAMNKLFEGADAKRVDCENSALEWLQDELNELCESFRSDLPSSPPNLYRLYKWKGLLNDDLLTKLVELKPTPNTVDEGIRWLDDLEAADKGSAAGEYMFRLVRLGMQPPTPRFKKTQIPPDELKEWITRQIFLEDSDDTEKLTRFLSGHGHQYREEILAVVRRGLKNTGEWKTFRQRNEDIEFRKELFTILLNDPDLARNAARILLMETDEELNAPTVGENLTTLHYPHTKLRHIVDDVLNGANDPYAMAAIGYFNSPLEGAEDLRKQFDVTYFNRPQKDQDRTIVNDAYNKLQNHFYPTSTE